VRVDVRQSDQLRAHLDEHVEHFHRAIWLTMDPIAATYS
jgi:hypothetical protein